jgi:hypothetical protein
VIVAADSEIQPDHVVLERHGDIERRRTGMIAHARADPADAGRLALFDCKLRRAPHHQMAHAIVAVDQSGGRPVAHHADIRLGIDAAGADAPHVKRQSDHTVGIAATQVGLDHQARQDCRISAWQAGGDESADNEGGEIFGRDAWVLGHARSGLSWMARTGLRPAEIIKSNADGR